MSPHSIILFINEISHSFSLFNSRCPGFCAWDRKQQKQRVSCSQIVHSPPHEPDKRTHCEQNSCAIMRCKNKTMVQDCDRHRPRALCDHRGGTCHPATGSQESHSGRKSGKRKTKQELTSVQDRGKVKVEHIVLFRFTCCVFAPYLQFDRKSYFSKLFPTNVHL